MGGKRSDWERFRLIMLMQASCRPSLICVIGLSLPYSGVTGIVLASGSVAGGTRCTLEGEGEKK